MAKNYICAHCGTVNDVKKVNKGTLMTEVAVWILALITAAFTYGATLFMAIVYSIWRLFNHDRICNACGKDELVDVSSPRGQKLIDEYTTE